MRALVVLAVVVATAAPVRAQPADVPGLIKLVQHQPSGMDRSAWKEQRRDAARKLGESKDKRAVPVLIQLAKDETFDIVGEIAIEGLGKLGDPSAIAPLQQIADDPSRDQAQRSLARKALKKLGANPEAAAGPAGASAGSGASGGAGPTGSTGPGGAAGPGDGAGAGSGALATEAQPGLATSTVGTAPGGGESLLGPRPASELPPLPDLPDDTLAASERLTFASGTADLGYDTIRKRLDFDADVAGSYARRIERERMAWGVNADAHVVTGVINPSGAGQSRGAEVVAHGDGEIRFYRGALYGVGKAAAQLQFNYTSDDDGMGNTFKSTQLEGDLQIALGGGYGRILDVGAAIRVRRLSRALDAARALGKPIDAATAKQLQLTWWALRGERSEYRALVATVAILRQAGILLGEPDAGLTYEILNVLRDTQIDLRPSGFDAQLAFGEGYLQRPDTPMNVERGRVELLLAQAGYAAQLDDDLLELSGTAFARLRLFPDMGAPAPRDLGATVRMRRFAYGAHGDPFGVFDLSGTVGLSNDDHMMSDTSLLLGAELGFTYWLNQASGLRLAANVTENNGVLVFGASFRATYGLLAGTFAR